ncbi:MAG: FG-GAP-like repeat-containing protein, partial [Patescibacteria group bacterium]
MELKTNKKRFVAIGLLLAFLLAPAISDPVAKAVIGLPDRYDLVAILVEKNLYRDTRDYIGLRREHPGLSEQTVKARVDRYASDLQNALNSTRALIIQVDADEKAEYIAKVLERLYFEGDPEEEGSVSKLAGVVIVGDVPLPVVTKGSSRFVSMFPYTDFEKKAYLFNSQSQDFEFSPQVADPQSEVWHGVIRPFLETSALETSETLARYFDKNHLFHTDDPGFSEFGKNIFFNDFEREKKGIIPEALGNYFNAMDHQEDIAYMRYTKELFDELYGNFQAKLAQDGVAPEDLASGEPTPQPFLGIDDDGDGRMDEDPVNGEDDDDDGDVDEDMGRIDPPEQSDEDTLSKLPDIKSKQLIDNYLAEYYELFQNFLPRINDMVRYTGRFSPDGDLDTMLNLITAKDRYTREYMRQVNNTLERKVDDAVGELQSDIPLVDEVIFEVEKVWVPAVGAEVEITPGTAPFSFTTVGASNFSGRGTGRVFGRSFNDITNASQCSAYRGSLPPAGAEVGAAQPGVISKLVEIGRVFYLKTAGGDKAPGERDRGDEDNPNAFGYIAHGGCFGASVDTYDTDGTRCFPHNAVLPVLNAGGTRERDSLPEGADDFRSCFNFSGKTERDEYNTKVFEYLGRLADPDEPLDEIRRDLPSLPSGIGNGRAFGIGGGLLDIVIEQGLRILGLQPGNYDLTVRDIVSSIPRGGGSYFDPDDMGQLTDELLGKVGGQPVQTLDLTIRGHARITRARVKITQHVVKEIPSVFEHKEPTSETIRIQNLAEATEALPVDNPRYVTFRDSRGEVRRVDYPNIFDAEDLDTVISMLRAKEIEIAVGQNELVSLIDREKISDALAWGWLNLEQKHLYVLRHYLNPEQDAFVGEREKGYELLVMNGVGSSDSMALDFNVEVPPRTPDFDAASSRDSSRNALEEARASEAAQAGANSDFPFGEPLDTSESYDIWSPPAGLPWFEEIKTWMESLEDTVSSYDFGEDEDSFYDQLESKQEKDLQKIRQELDDEDARAFLEDPSLPSRVAELELSSDFPVTLAGGKKPAPVMLIPKDKDGDVIADEAVPVTISVASGEVSVEGVRDENTEVEGVQVTVLGGKMSFLVKGGNTPGIASIRVVAENGKEGTISITVASEVSLVITADRTQVPANGRDQIGFSVRAVDGRGQLLTRVNGRVKASLSGDDFGSVAGGGLIALVNGQGRGSFITGKKSGVAGLMVRGGPGYSSSQVLEFLPGPPSFILLNSDGPILSQGDDDFVTVSALLFDSYGNFTYNAPETPVRIKLDSGSENFGTFERGGVLMSRTLPAVNGKASLRIFPTGNAGPVRIVAESAGLRSGRFELEARYSVRSKDIREMDPDSLYVSLLGLPGGDVVSPRESLGQSFLFSGRVQAVTSLTTQPILHKKLAEITDRGGIRLPEDSDLEVRFISGTPLTAVLYDPELRADVARITMIPPIGAAYSLGAITADAIPADLTHGVYVRQKEAGLSATSSTLDIIFENKTIARINDRGGIELIDPAVTLSLIPGPVLGMEVRSGMRDLAEVYFVQNFDRDVRVIRQAPASVGISVKPLDTARQLKFEPFFAGNSTGSHMGVAITDISQEAEGSSQPGFSSVSLEDSHDVFGVGFGKDNKHALLFSGGSTVGESNRPFASDIGIVLGDPSIRIDNTPARGTKFTRDIGKFVFDAGEEIRGLVDLDHNGDGAKDLLAVKGEGSVQLVQNNSLMEGGGFSFKDQDLLLKAANGIISFTKGDFNNDGQEDIALAAERGCRAGDSCVDIYYNRGGVFARENLQFEQTEKITLIKSADLNNDDTLDLIVADAGGTIMAFYNQRGVFDNRPSIIGNVGLKVNPAENLNRTILVGYRGMPEPQDGDAASNGSFSTVSYEVPAPERRQGVPGVAEDVPTRIVSRSLIYADLDPVFLHSTKFAQDLNGDIVRTGDRIKYTVTLRNSSGRAVSDVILHELVPGSVSLNEGSITCDDCGTGSFAWRRVDDAARPILFYNISIPSGASRTISYEGDYSAEVSTGAELMITVTKDTPGAYPVQDRLPTISVSAKGNPTGQVRYYYSTGVANDRVVYASVLSDPAGGGDAVAAPTQSQIAQGLREDAEDALRQSREGSSEIQSQHLENLSRDTDGDGLIDQYDEVEGGLDQVANAVQDVTSKLYCDAGCIAMPINISFLTPGPFSILGTPAGFDPGLPVFGWGAPPPPFVWPPIPHPTTAGGRIYVSPTLTGALGTAICLGPYPTGLCWAFGVNPLALTGACDAINGGITGALSKANGAIADVNEGLVVDLGGNNRAQSPRDSGGMSSYNLGNYSPPSSSSMNIRVPGFPSVVTDWWAAQLEEFQKMLDFPDLYVIYPDFSSATSKIVPDFSNVQSFADVFTRINSIPLIKIEDSRVVYKVPLITRKEFERVKFDAERWVEDLKLEWEKTKELWQCATLQNTNGDNGTCDFFDVQVNDLAAGVNKNLEILEEYLLLPKKVLDYRQVEAFYMRQIIDYLDTIINYTGGYLRKNEARIAQWKRAVRTIKEAIENWQALIDVQLDYKESCDRCQTERYTLTELILKLVAVIPTPPVVPMPQLPDIVLDVSKIQAGVTIDMPSVEFVPEQLILPRLPRIQFPLELPRVRVTLPGLPTLPEPPPFPQLPALPELNLPKLPDIPPPPKLPSIPNSIRITIDAFKKLMKIYCLIKSGLVP